MVAGTSLLPLSTLAGTIKAHIAAGDKNIAKAEEHYKAAGIHLKEARDRAKAEGTTFSAFIAKECSLGRSRAYELIAIADGTKTLAETRADNRKRDGKRRERQSSSVAHGQPNEDVDEPSPSSRAQHARQQKETPERMDIFDRVVTLLKKLDAEQLSEVETHITENYDV